MSKNDKKEIKLVKDFVKNLKEIYNPKFSKLKWTNILQEYSIELIYQLKELKERNSLVIDVPGGFIINLFYNKKDFSINFSNK